MSLKKFRELSHCNSCFEPLTVSDPMYICAQEPTPRASHTLAFHFRCVEKYLVEVEVPFSNLVKQQASVHLNLTKLVASADNRLRADRPQSLFYFVPHSQAGLGESSLLQHLRPLPHLMPPSSQFSPLFRRCNPI